MVTAGIPRLSGRFESVEPSANDTGKLSAFDTEIAAWTIGEVEGTRPAGRMPTVSIETVNAWLLHRAFSCVTASCTA